MGLVESRETKAQFILSFLPLTLYFPVGITNAGVLLFLLTLTCSGGYRTRLQNVRNSPIFVPVMTLLVVCCVAAVFQERSLGFWKAFLHYQIYFFLLLFISVGGGRWQERAIMIFLIGAMYAATVFYFEELIGLPDWAIFQNYIEYQGNKSILIGILMALACGLILNDIFSNRSGRWLRIFAFLYICAALLMYAKTRSGSVILLLSCMIVTLRHLRFSRNGFWIVLIFALFLCVAWFIADGVRDRLLNIVHDLRAFSQGGAVSDGGVRLELYRITLDIIQQNPMFGSGIGNWVVQYPERAQGLFTQNMVTPHNDYLLYTAEIGLVGLLAQLWIWMVQLVTAIRVGDDNGVRLFVFGVAIMFGAAVNAILRDALFGMAFMILLSIPLAGVSRQILRSR